MKNKFLVLEDLTIVLDNEAPNQLARITFIAYATKQKSVRSESYATISGSSIRWTEHLRVPYDEQNQILFETECEFEYGFQKQQMKSRFEGTIYMKQQFYVISGTTQVFQISGQKVGTLSYTIKMTSVNPAFGKVREKTPEEAEQEVYQPDFRGRVIVYAATLKFKEPTLEVWAGKLALRLRLGSCVLKTRPTEDAKWTQTLKFDRHEEQSLDCEVLDADQKDSIVAKGSLLLEALERNKRFTVQSIVLRDLNRKQVGQLTVDMRFIDKDEVVKMRIKHPHVRHHNLSVEVEKAPPNRDAKSHSIIPKKQKVSELSRSLLSNEDLRSDTRQYNSSQLSKKVHVINGYNQIIIPRARRFPKNQPANPYVSYVDPEEVSVFGRRGKGASIGLGNKHDFTAVRKQNPGVGQYRLPSIWDKY